MRDNESDSDFTEQRLRNSYRARAKLAKNPAAKKLFEIMEQKKTNLALAADFYDVAQLFAVIDAIGPHIAVLKTHMDLMNYESMNIKDVLEKLKAKAKEHNFLIFEDRKFIDIGGVAKRQYTSGTFQINSWAHLVNAYALPGPGTIKAISEGAKEFLANNPEEVRGLILLPYMTPDGNLFSEEVAQGTMNHGKEHSEFVMGWIGAGAPAGKLEHEARETPPGTLILTPGCKFPDLEKKVENERLGQVYTDPKNLVSRGSDIIIVGSGIYKKPTYEEQIQAAKVYQEAGWQAYKERLNSD